MKKVILSLCGFMALISTSSASTVSLNRGLNPGFNVLSPGGTILSSFSMLIGSFNSNPSSGISATELQALLATGTAFNEFGAATAPANGLLTGSVTKNDFSVGPAATAFNNRNIYVVVMNGATSAASSAFGLITVDTTSTAGTWVFPADVTSALVTTNAPTGTLANFATVLGTEIDNPTSPESFRLSAVPEPSASLLLVLLGSLGILRRKR